tara:strand:+ start:28578 stop:29354 length:777 start_codon:yes stop_codon:yes gene_type:complete
MPVFETAQRRLFYEWNGRDSGPVLVLSHSLGASHNLWNPQIEELGERFRLLVYDQRGHGNSSHPAGAWSIAEFGRDVIELLDFLDLERVSFCGLSLGGMVGLWLGQETPDRMEKLVLANCAARIEDPGLLRSRADLIRKLGLSCIAENVLDRWFTSGFRASNPGLLAEIREMLLATKAEGYAATCDALCAMDLMKGLGEMRTPSLVIYGRHDRATPPEWTRQFAGLMPDARVIELDSAHLSNHEASAAFNAAVLEFLR